MKCDVGLESILILILQIRQNVVLHRSCFDMNDPLLVEGPAKGAHSEYVSEAQHQLKVLNLESW